MGVEEEFTPTTAEVRDMWSYDADDQAEFDRWLAERDSEIREQIAREIEADFRYWASLEGAAAPLLHSPEWLLERTYQNAARIARGEST